VIAYHLICHENFLQVAKLLESLYTKNDVFLIDVDDSNSPRMFALRKWLKRDNVHINLDANIGWGASGILRKTLLGMFQLLTLDNSWRYYINLSGQDLPLKSNTQIKEFLAEGDKESTSFMRCFKADPIEIESVEIDNKGDKSVLLDVAEAGEDGAVYVGTVDPLLHSYRKAFFKKHPFHIGSNWFNLHRDLVEDMQENPFTNELYAVLKTTSNPDESFFQTYIMNSQMRDKVNRNYCRLIVRPGEIPRVKIFDRNDWNMIAESSALFARKFDTREDRKIVKQVLAARSEQTVSSEPHFGWRKLL